MSRLRSSVHPPLIARSIEDAMSSRALGYYFRSFLVKLNTVESQLAHIDTMGGMSMSTTLHLDLTLFLDDISFAIVLELKNNVAPTAHQGQVNQTVTPPM